MTLNLDAAICFDSDAIRERFLDARWIHPNWRDEPHLLTSLSAAEWQAIGASALRDEYLWQVVDEVVATALREHLADRDQIGLQHTHVIEPA